MVIILHQSVLMFSNNSMQADIQYIYLQCQPQLTISSYGIPIRCNVKNHKWQLNPVYSYTRMAKGASNG